MIELLKKCKFPRVSTQFPELYRKFQKIENFREVANLFSINNIFFDINVFLQKIFKEKEALPAARVKAQTKVYWLLDEAAASELN